MLNTFYHIGKYFMLLARVFNRPEKHTIYWRQALKEIISLGLGSLGIITIISFFMGAVITIQTGTNMDASWIPRYLLGYGARQSIVLEFSTTMICLILAGKVGSSIASELGTMRVTEQIDALEIMGINSASYLILPKIAAAVFINPFLMYISMFIGIFGAWVAGILSGLTTTTDFVYGLQYDFAPFSIIYATVKMLFFSFAITSISAYHGYYVKGGALEVSQASTKAVVYSSIMILILNYILTQLLLV